MTQDIICTNIDLFEQYYKRKNFRIEIINPNNKNTLLCFSSHAVYFPFTEEAFIEKIVEKDYYEHISLLRDERIRNEFGKIIYFRDLYKEWYVNGISEEDDCISKIVSKISNLTEGETIYTLGSSSGGYLASIIGIKLNAEAVFTLSGQFSLEQWMNRKYLSKYSSEIERNKYFDITEMVKQTKTPIFYFYPAYSEDDKKQYALVKDFSNVHAFAFAYNEHGRTINEESISYIVQNRKKLMKLSKKKQLYTSESFYYKVAGIGSFKNFITGFFKKKKKINFHKDVL